MGPIVPGLYRARTKKSKFGKILVKEIKKLKERYCYFDFSLEQDIISKPDLKRGIPQKPNESIRTNIKEDIYHLDFVFVYRYAFYQCIK